MTTGTKLRVWDARGELAQLRRTSTSVVLEKASPDVSADLRRWVKDGLVEQVGEPGRRRPRVTSPSDPLLLERIAERLDKYGFQTRFVADLAEWTRLSEGATAYRVPTELSPRIRVGVRRLVDELRLRVDELPGETFIPSSGGPTITIERGKASGYVAEARW